MVWTIKLTFVVLRTSDLLPDFYEDCTDLAGRGWRSIFLQTPALLRGC